MRVAEALGQYPESPCVGICRIGNDGCCEGCLRTLDEIARWGEMTAAERGEVYAALAGRRICNGPQGREYLDECRGKN